MNKEGMLFLFLSCLGLIASGFGVYALFFNEQLGKRLTKYNRLPWVPWTMKEDAELWMRILTLLGFITFLTITLVYIVYSLSSIIN